MNTFVLIDISQLRIGMYIQLDLGWMHHPFPVSSFRIGSAEQIATLRELGLTSVKVLPKKSDPEFRDGLLATPADSSGNATDGSADSSGAPAEQPTYSSPGESAALRRRMLLAAQNASLLACDRRFRQATKQYMSMEKLVAQQPKWLRQKGSCWLPSALQTFWKMVTRPFVFFPRG